MDQIFIIKKIPTVLTTSKAKLLKNNECENAIKEMLIERNLIPKEHLKKVIFMKVRIKNSKIDESRIMHNAKIVVNGNYDMSDKLDISINIIVGFIKIEKFLSPMERQFHKDIPMIAIVQRCFQCNCLNHAKSGKNGCKYRKEHMKREANRLIQNGMVDGSDELKNALKIFKPPKICRKCSSLTDSHFEKDCKNKKKCLNCGKIGDHRTIDYEDCEKFQYTSMKLWEFFALKYGAEYSMEDVKKDYPRGVSLSTALNGIKYYKAKNTGKEKEYFEDKRKEKEMNQTVSTSL